MMTDTQQRPQPLVTTHGAERPFESPITALTATADGLAFAVGTLDGDMIFAPLAASRSPENWHVSACMKRPLPASLPIRCSVMLYCQGVRIAA